MAQNYRVGPSPFKAQPKRAQTNYNNDESTNEFQTIIKSESANNTPSMYQKKITDSKIQQVQQQYKINGSKVSQNEKFQSNAYEQVQDQYMKNSHARSFSTRLENDYSAKKTQPRQTNIYEDNDNISQHKTPTKDSPKKSKTPFSRSSKDTKSNYSYVIMLEPDSFPDLGLTKEPSINKSIKNDNTNANRSNLNSTQNDLSNSVKRTKYIKRSETSQTLQQKQQLSAQKNQARSKANLHATQNAGSQSVHHNQLLNTSQSLKNISQFGHSQYLEEDSFNDISFFNNVNQNLSAMNFSHIHLTQQQQQMQQTQNMSKLQKEFQQQLKQTTGRVQRLFQKKPQASNNKNINNSNSNNINFNSTINSNIIQQANKSNSKTRNNNNYNNNNNTSSTVVDQRNRSLSKSVSEQKFNQTNLNVSNTMKDEMNKTQIQSKLDKSIHKAETNTELQNYLNKDLSVQSSNNMIDCGDSQISKEQTQSFQKLFQLKYNLQDHSRVLHNIDAMIQQVTPSSSSNPSQTIEDEQFLELESMINNSCNMGPGLGLQYSNLQQPQAMKQDSVMSQFDSITVQKNIDLDVIFKFLIAEEEQLNQFTQMIQAGQLIEMQQQLPAIKTQYQYLDLIQSVNCKKERPKYFAQQLQVSLIFANAMIQIFTPSYLQKFSHKLRMVYTNIHQNFLLFIDQILNCCNANPSNSLNYVLLRKLIVKKLKNKLKSKRITLLRQNNEVNLLNLKKICKFMATNSSSQAQVIGSIDIVNPFSQEYKEIGSEMLEILRVYEKITIFQITERLAKKDDIVNVKQQQILNSPTTKRAKSNLKNSSPRQSPRTLANHYSPANSSKSLRSAKNSQGSDSTKNLDSNLARSAPKRGKLVKPTFDYSKKDQSEQNRKNSTQKITNSRVAQNQYESLGTYDKSQEYVTVDNRTPQDIPHEMGTVYSEGSSQYDQNQFSQPQPHKSVFFLPESMAFILSNSIECNNGITNINNNINIYNSSNIDINQLRKDAKNAKVVGKINTKTGEIQVQQNNGQQSTTNLHKNESVPFIKRTSMNAAKSQQKYPINTNATNNTNHFQKQPNYLKPNSALNSSKLNASRLNSSSLSQNNSIQRSQLKSRQQTVNETQTQKQVMSRVSSKLNFDSNQPNPLIDEALERLDLNQIDLSRQTSINNSTVKSSNYQPNTAMKQFKSANQSPNKKAISRPGSRQVVGQTGKSLIQNKQSFQDANNFQQKSNLVRAQSRQLLTSSASKKSLIATRSKANLDIMRSDIETSSISSTPMKQPDYITNQSISLSTDKNHKPLFSANKKNQIITPNQSNKKPVKASAQLHSDNKIIPTKNISIASPQPKRQVKASNVSKNQEKSFIQKAVQQTKKLQQKEQLHLTSDQLSQLHLQSFGLEVNSLDGDQDDKFYSDNHIPQINQFNQLPQIQPHTTQNIISTNRSKAKTQYDEIFDINEFRLDNLLDKMNNHQLNQRQDQLTSGQVSKQDTQRTIETFNQIEVTPTNASRKSKVDADIEDVSKTAKMLQFGTLLEQHMGSLDLKKEMEKLKQLDEEQKRQKKISLRVNTRESCAQNQSNQQSNNISMNQSVNGSFSIQHSVESPTKRILIGEFDEDNQDDDDMLLNNDDDLLLSAETLKHLDSKKHSDVQPVYDFTDYITQKTGMEDPFPDHQDPDEEAISPSKRSTSGQNNNISSSNISNTIQDQSAPTNTAVDEQLRKNDEESQRLRQMVKIPYLPALDKKEYEKTYTLVLDLDETLIHFECDDDAQDEDEQGYYLIRPGAIKFLNELSKYYELVIFTAAMPDYADWIVDNIDRHRIIKHRLYRQHTTPHEDYAIKDLRNLGRALERTIIIDNLAENFIHTTPDNGIWVESWYDDMDDTVMEQLIPFLREIVTSKVDDVRKILTKQNKENILYRCLEENKDIPSVRELLDNSPHSSYKRRWGLAN